MVLRNLLHIFLTAAMLFIDTFNPHLLMLSKSIQFLGSRITAGATASNPISFGTLLSSIEYHNNS